MRRNPNPPPAHVRFQKGKSGNPLGAKIHNQELKKIRALTKAELASIGSMVLEKDFKELKKIAEDPNEKTLAKWFATIAVDAVNKKYFANMNNLLNRIVGPVTTSMEVAGPNGKDLLPSSSEERAEKLATILATLQKITNG